MADLRLDSDAQLKKLVDALVAKVGPDVVLFTRAAKDKLNPAGNNMAAPAMNNLK